MDGMHDGRVLDVGGSETGGRERGVFSLFQIPVRSFKLTLTSAPDLGVRLIGESEIRSFD